VKFELLGGVVGLVFVNIQQHDYIEYICDLLFGLALLDFMAKGGLVK